MRVSKLVHNVSNKCTCPSVCAGTPPAEDWPVSLLFNELMQIAFHGHEWVLMKVKERSHASGRLTSLGACPRAW